MKYNSNIIAVGALMLLGAPESTSGISIYPFYDPNECCACPVSQKVIKGRPETAHSGYAQLNWRQNTDDYKDKRCCECPEYQGEGIHPYYEKISKPYGWPASYPGQEYFNN